MSENQLPSDQLKLTKGISFNTYAKQLPSLEISEEIQEQFRLPLEPLQPQTQNPDEKYCNLEEIISKVRKDYQSNQNLFEQIIMNKGDEIYQLTKFPSQNVCNRNINSANMHINNNYEQKEVPSKNEENKLQQSTSAQINNQNSNSQIIQEQQQQQEEQNSQQDQKPSETRIICNCKKSHCIKLYCECFNKGLMCNEFCKCTDCKNKPQFQAKREKAIQYLLKKNQSQGENEQNNSADIQGIFSKPKDGCNCTKSHCIKKYCECYNSGKKCTEKCKCISCKNGGLQQFNEEEQKKLIEKYQESLNEGIAYNLRKKIRKQEDRDLISTTN